MMRICLYVAAFLTAACGLAHSYLGERYILVRLFRRADLPTLFGGTEFTKRTIRLAWHVTSIAWWGLAAMLILFANPPISGLGIGMAVGVTLLATAATILIGSHGRHLAWPVFLTAGALTLYATLGLAFCLIVFSDTLAAQQPTTSVPNDSSSYPHASEPIGTVRQMYDGALTPEMAVNTFRNIDRLFPTRAVAHGAHPKPLPRSSRQLVDVHFSDGDSTYDLKRYLELNRVSGLLVLKNGRIAIERYRYGNSARTRWMSMSVAKSITSTLIGAALAQHRIASLGDSVTRYVTALKGSAYDGVSVRDILMMSSGVRWIETYTDSSSDRRHLLEAQIAQQPGTAMKLMGSLPRKAKPGFVNNYSTGETVVAGEVVASAVGRPLAEYLSERIWARYAMEADARWWLDSPNGHEIGGSGFSATLRDYGRFGEFILDGGIASGEQILPKGWVHEASTPKMLRDGSELPYGYFWWPGTSRVERRDRAFEANGIFGQHIYINPAEHLVIVVWGAQTKPTGGGVIDDWNFFDAVAKQLR